MTELLIERTKGVVTLTLNRPEKRNALSASLVEALLAALEDAAAADTRLLVLKGAGRNFSAGFDFTGLETQSEGDLVLRFTRIEMLLQALYHAPFDTLALAHGQNFGAGVDLVCACARRIAEAGTRFQMPGLRFGILLGTRRTAARVGPTEARRVLQEGRTFDGAAGLASGFLTELAATEHWDEVVRRAAEAATALTADAAARLFDAVAQDTRNQDLAALVRSAALPGLKSRIEAYRCKSAPKWDPTWG